ncbi:lysine (K)-specific demethylase 2Aa isoform X2 [Hoplias malabaricus]|uniref:lysine (K)-specific demethylase 2Aa isoform X2 n=2 Tax=Hoplias malabaricus TaxID=27720 RepID=UPI003462A429
MAAHDRTLSSGRTKRSGTRRRYHDDGISDDEIEGKRTFDLEEKLRSSRFSSDRVKRMEGKDFNFEYVQRGGLRDPIIFERPEGLGIKMPDPDFSVNDVKTFVGSRRMIDVMEVASQKGIEMSMAQWTRYYETPPSQREKLYNVISLEFSHTKLENFVKRPATVDMIDWVDNMWPRHLKERQRDSTNSIIDMQYPKVQKYCLMSVQGCYTDFHIDFGGTSVWYHILRGGKVFWLIPPTPQNLELYENWVLSGKQGDIFLGDRATDCQRIELKQGYTFIIPSGWIHAVYTPVDTLVFGGNFLHSFNVPTQLNIYSIEDRTRVSDQVPAKFRYPFYYEMCWYVLERYLYSLTNTSYLIPEFQKHSLGIGLKREASNSDTLNGHVKEEEEIYAPSPPSRPGVKVHLTPFELEGLWNLLGKLESLPSHKKCVPAGIHNAPALLHDIRALLKEHANDIPKLSYTGRPIVKWPKRPSWYQPPPPPAPVGRPKLATTPIIPRPTKPASSMSVLRRRRVRCKRCEACLRAECGECNFCRDMKKFGGPGKLKQTCVLRQCLAPGLPLSAVCEICEEGNQDTGEELMECSNCAQIAHPSCLKVPGEGVVNKDLPSCWECPKCVAGKDTASESSGSGDDITAQEGSGGLRGEGRAWHGVGRPPSSSLPHGSLRKQVAAPEQQLRKRIKLEGGKMHKRKSSSLDPRVAKIYRRHGMDRDDESGSEDEDGDGRRKLSLQSRSGLSVRRGLGTGKRGVWRSASHRRGKAVGGISANSASLKMKRGLSVRGDRGGRVRLRGGSKMHRRRYETEDEDDDDDDDEDEDDDDDEEDDESEEERHMGRSGKEHRSRRRRRRGEDDDEDEDEDSEEQDFDGEDEEMEDLDNGGEEEEDDEDGDNYSDSETDPPVLLVSDLNDELLNGSYLTVTLQRPAKARRDPGAIVPKLEAAMSPRTPGAADLVQRKSLKFRHKNGSSLATGNGLSQPKAAPASGRLKRSNNDGREGETASPSSNSSRSSISPPPPPPPSSTSSSPPSLLSHPSFRDVGNEPGCEKEVWVSVFRYLSCRELTMCMTVCKAWYKWSCDKRLWSHIDLSRCRALSPQAVTSIVKRQPVTLDLSWTPVSKKQITWLILHLPGLKDLILSGCSSSCVSALGSQSGPSLRTLDLCWAEGVKESHLKDLITPPGSENRSRLKSIVTLRLSGLDVSDSILKLIIKYMPLLKRLDLSHCQSLTDQSVSLMTASGSNMRNTLREVNLAGCNKLTDASMSYMKRLSALTLLDLRGCKGVTRLGCENFISDLSYCTFFCLTEDKLIQRIS